MSTPGERAWELVLRHRDYYGTYHHQKENAAYAATAFYLGGASAVIMSTSWLTWPRHHLAALAVAMFITGLLTLAFVLWQFKQRIFAVNMVAACTDLAARWVNDLPQEADLRTAPLDNRQWPSVLVRTIQEVQHHGAFWPRELAVAAIVLWTAGAIAKIVATCP